MGQSITIISDILKSLKQLNEEAEIVDKEAERVINENKRLLLLL